MANITFILGNGFDLNLGLKTSYKHFYDVYKEVKTTDSPAVVFFKENILNPNIDKWGDFEKSYGEIRDKAFSAEMYKECFVDFVNCLRKHLIHQQERIDWNKISSKNLKDILWKSIFNIENNLHYKNKQILQNIKGNTPKQPSGKINFIQFNYTNVIDEILKNQSNIIEEYLQSKYENTIHYFYDVLNVNEFGVNLHIHGDVTNYMVVGVDSIDQIKEPLYHSDEELNNIVIKPRYLDVIQDNLMEEIEAEVAIKVISESSVIVLFGKAISYTDKRWWCYISNWLFESSNHNLLIVDKIDLMNDMNDPKYQAKNFEVKKSKEKEIRDDFKRLSELEDIDYEKCKDQIFIDFNTDLFKFDLGLTDENKTPEPALK